MSSPSSERLAVSTTSHQRDNSELELNSIARVFRTTELLEQILLHVPAWRLIHLQRVCKLFRNNIQNSIHLQRLLFLTPQPLAASPDLLRYNPLITTWWSGLASWTSKDMRGEVAMPTKGVIFSDHEGNTYQAQQHLPYATNPDVHDGYTNGHHLMWQLKALDGRQMPTSAAASLPTSSFYSMYLSQPPLPVKVVIWTMKTNSKGVEGAVGHERFMLEGGKVGEILTQIARERAKEKQKTPKHTKSSKTMQKNAAIERNEIGKKIVLGLGILWLVIAFMMGRLWEVPGNPN